MPWAEGFCNARAVCASRYCQNLFLLQKKSGDEAVKAVKGAQGLQLSKLLEGDPEFDSGLPSSKDFLSAQGLQCLAS